MSTEADCVKKKQNNLTRFSNCKQWGELLASWINWSATDFRQVTELFNWLLSDIKQPKWCRIFGRRIFFRHLFSPNEVLLCQKFFFFRIWRQWRPVAQTLLSVAMETRVLIQSAPKPYAAFPIPQWCYTKYDQDWPSGCRDIQIWKCGRQTDDGPLVYYKLTLWAFGSGELKIH